MIGKPLAGEVASGFQAPVLTGWGGHNIFDSDVVSNVPT